VCVCVSVSGVLFSVCVCVCDLLIFLHKGDTREGRLHRSNVSCFYLIEALASTKGAPVRLITSRPGFLESYWQAGPSFTVTKLNG